MPVELAPETAAFLENTCVFCQPWWLEAVSPGRWGVAVARRGNEVAAVWPYAYKLRLGRYRLLEIPQLTFYLGPWLRSSQAKSARRLETEKDLMTELVDALPAFAAFHQWFHPSVTNWLPLYWRGFSQMTRYTYRLDDTSDLDAIWQEVKENIRRNIRKARQQSVSIVEDQSIDRFLELERATFARQGRNLPFGEQTLRRLDAECMARGVRNILSAVDSAGRVHASDYLVWDDHAVYSLLRATDPELRSSGAASLVMWSAIEFASEQRKAFDFVGSWVESIERFVRAFGGRQVPFFEVRKTPSAVVRGYRQMYRWIRWKP